MQLLKYVDGKTTVVADLPESARGIAYLPTNQLLFVNQEDGSLQVVNDKGQIKVWLPGGQLFSPNAVCVGLSGLYVEDAQRLVMAIDPRHMMVSPMLGQRGQENLRLYRVNSEMSSDSCGGLCVDFDGSVLIASPKRNRIFRAGTDSLLVDWIGTGEVGFSTGHAQCRLNRPCGIARVDTRTVVSDTGNFVLRIFRGQDPLSVIGMPGEAGGTDSADGMPRFQDPTDLADLGSAVVVLDGWNLRLCHLNSQTVETVYRGRGPLRAVTTGRQAIYFTETLL